MGGNRLNQRIELRDVVAILGSRDDRERDTLRVDDEMVLAAELAPVRWVRAVFSREHRANRRAVDNRACQCYG